MIDKPSQGHSLFFSTTENVIPIILCAITTLSSYDIVKSYFAKQIIKIIIGDTLVLLLLMGVWVDKLVSQSTIWKIGSLRNIEDLVKCWLMQHSAVEWPELAHYSK